MKSTTLFTAAALLFSSTLIDALPTEVESSVGVEARAPKVSYQYIAFPPAKKPVKCAARELKNGDMRDAAEKAAKLINANATVGKNKYPHQYNNNEQLKFNDNCDGKKLQEFPIFPNKIYDDGSPEADRIVVAAEQKMDKKGDVKWEITYCGLMTHEGVPVAGGFRLC